MRAAPTPTPRALCLHQRGGRSWRRRDRRRCPSRGAGSECLRECREASHSRADRQPAAAADAQDAGGRDGQRQRQARLRPLAGRGPDQGRGRVGDLEFPRQGQRADGDLHRLALDARLRRRCRALFKQDCPGCKVTVQKVGARQRLAGPVADELRAAQEPEHQLRPARVRRRAAAGRPGSSAGGLQQQGQDRHHRAATCPRSQQIKAGRLAADVGRGLPLRGLGRRRRGHAHDAAHARRDRTRPGAPVRLDPTSARSA